jgi:AraC-like DNA-binding protein
MATLLTTDSIAQDERVEWWHERATELFGARYHIEPDKQAPFQMGLAIECAEPLVLFKAQGSAHRALRRDGGGDNAKVVVHLQLEGHCTVRAEGRDTLLKPGNLTLHRVSKSNDLHFHDAYRQICAVVPESVLETEFRDWSQYAGAAIPTATGTAAVLADHMRSLANHSEVLLQPGASELTSFTIGLVRATLQTLKSGEAGMSLGLRAYHLGRVKRFALAHLHVPALDVDLIAGGVGLSPRYIHRLFEDEPLPLMRWVMKERLERAYAQLQKTRPRPSISSIAYAWGFNDHAHFTRSFRKQFGLSPREVLSSDESLAKP